MYSIKSTFAFMFLFELTTLEIEITDFYCEFYVKPLLSSYVTFSVNFIIMIANALLYGARYHHINVLLLLWKTSLLGL